MSLEAKGSVKPGFGYDPVFISNDCEDGRTFAQLLPEEKNRISHRSRALEKFISYLME